MIWDFSVEADKNLEYRSLILWYRLKEEAVQYFFWLQFVETHVLKVKSRRKFWYTRTYKLRLKNLWKAVATPMVYGALGTYSDKLEKNPKRTEIPYSSLKVAERTRIRYCIHSETSA